MAVGGYGRAEMSPHSDVDIAFLVGGKKTAWCEQVVEAMLYLLWDLGLKVGHSTRTLDEAMRLSKTDRDDPHSLARRALRMGRSGALR